MPQQKKYSDELRARAIRLVFDSGRPIAQVARDLGIHPESLGDIPPAEFEALHDDHPPPLTPLR